MDGVEKIQNCINIKHIFGVIVLIIFIVVLQKFRTLRRGILMIYDNFVLVKIDKNNQY